MWKAPTEEVGHGFATEFGDVAIFPEQLTVWVQRPARAGVAGGGQPRRPIVMSACVGAGLTRWDAATRVIEEAANAPG